jgi:DNA-binding transcriptional MerR regulator/methylmalonyl-CoA mutase cobalamin-binding subunit
LYYYLALKCISGSGMNKETTKTKERDDGVYTIGTVANLTGVNAITLRAWERRYQLFEPIRKASGHRLYTQQHIDLITRVVGLLDRGMRIGQVKASLEQDSKVTDEQTTELRDSWQLHLDSMIAAVIRFDEAALEEAYGIALSLYSENKVTEKLLIPLLTELGRRWAEGEGSIAEEHFFGFYLRNKLGARFHHRFKVSSGPTLLMACLPSEHHETGLLLAALAANQMGYHTILLGANMPLEELPAAARKTQCDAIVLSAMLGPPAGILDRGLADLTSKVDVPVFLGGRVSQSSNDLLQKAGVHTLGTNLARGLQRLSDLVPLE